MAISYSCDGCGTSIADPIKVGHVTRREYCKSCAGIAGEFIKMEESLRKATQEKFLDDRALLIARFSENGFKLPDLPTC